VEEFRPALSSRPLEGSSKGAEKNSASTSKGWPRKPPQAKAMPQAEAGSGFHHGAIYSPRVGAGCRLKAVLKNSLGKGMIGTMKKGNP